jgi:hypothetical protein
MTRSTRGLTVPYLALVVAGLCYLNWWQANTIIDIAPIAPEAANDAVPDSTQPVAPANDALKSLADFSETVSRPLFRSDRRPPVAKPAEMPAPTVQEPPPALSPADSLRLVGMMRSGTSARRALIRVAGLPTATWVETGGEVGGWTVGKIEADRVLIERNGDKAELKLFAPKPVEAPKP